MERQNSDMCQKQKIKSIIKLTVHQKGYIKKLAGYESKPGKPAI